VSHRLERDPRECSEERFRLLMEAHQARARERLLRETMLEIERERKKRQQLTEQLQRQNRELGRLDAQKDEFLGMAAHDLRNPLTAVQGFAETLLAEPVVTESEMLNEFITIIRDSAQDMLNLVNDILDINKIAAGKLELHAEQVDLRDLVRASCLPNRFVAERKGIELQEVVPEQAVPATVDPLRIRQVLDNLLSNAIKFSSGGTTITVSLEQLDGHAALSVADQGQGIAPADLPKLFEPFQQTETRATAGEKGTGLGLAIIKKIVEMHGGEIEARSKLGEGSTFTVTLPT
jgi:signal transduction histidine kinase